MGKALCLLLLTQLLWRLQVGLILQPYAYWSLRGCSQQLVVAELAVVSGGAALPLASP